MNLELNGHRITLGPKALAFIETSMRGMGETYCRDQLALWLAGGKVDADVTIEGPVRCVAKGNEIGIGMMPDKAEHIDFIEPTQARMAHFGQRAYRDKFGTVRFYPSYAMCEGGSGGGSRDRLQARALRLQAIGRTGMATGGGCVGG